MLFFFTGLFSAFCAVKDYDWFMNNKQVQFYIKLFGRNNMRVFYILIGLIMICVAVVIFFVNEFWNAL